MALRAVLGEKCASVGYAPRTRLTQGRAESLGGLPAHGDAQIRRHAESLGGNSLRSGTGIRIC